MKTPKRAPKRPPAKISERATAPMRATLKMSPAFTISVGNLVIKAIDTVEKPMETAAEMAIKV